MTTELGLAGKSSDAACVKSWLKPGKGVHCYPSTRKWVQVDQGFWDVLVT